MPRTLVVSSLALLLIAVCSTGCQPNLDRPSTTSTTGAVVGATDATHRLARARCDRELLCNDIGEGKEFEDWNRCEAKSLELTRIDLEAAGCKKGIGERYLVQCLSALREASCSNPLESLDRVQICRRGKLCAD